jgi:hypothetical protein
MFRAHAVMAAMQRNAALHPIFNVEIMRRMIPCGYICVVLQSAHGEHQVMMKRQNVVAALRRDVTFVGNAVVAVVFIGFASLALAAALLDFMSIRH